MEVANQSLIKILSVFIIMIVSFLFCVVASQASPASEALVSEGRAIFFSNIQGDNPTYSAFLEANEKFKEACAADPEDYKANLFYALTRLAAFALGNGDGSTPETLMDLLGLFGLPPSESDYLNDDGPPYKEKELYGYFYLDDTAPSGEIVRNFLAEAFMEVLDGSLSNLRPIQTAFKLIIYPEETGGDTVEVDYGDVQVLMSGLYTLKAFLHILTAYNLEVDIHRISVLANTGVLQMQKDLLDTYPDLLRLRPTDGAQSLSLARQALIDGIKAFDNAFNVISERLSQGNNLFYFGSDEEKSEAEELLSFLVEARNSLTGNRVAEFDEDFRVDVNRFFGNSGKSPLDLRAVLPEFDDRDNIVPGTFPGDPLLNGIIPDLRANRDLTIEMDLQPSGYFTIPRVSNNSIIMDGSAADWPTNALVFTDLDDDLSEYADFEGMDINQFFLAKDDNFLYMGLSFYDSGPWAENTAGYPFQANASYDRHDTLGDRMAGVWYHDDNWAPNVVEKADDGSPYSIISYDPSYAAAGTGFIEWKVPLSDMGNLSGKYVRTYSHLTGGYPPQYPPSDDNLTGILLDPVSISGTISCPAHNGTGTIFIWAVDVNSYSYSRWFGPKLASGYINSPGSYQLSGLTPGRQIVLIAFWDKDDNGILTFGDFVTGGLETIPDNGPLTLDLNINQEINDNNILTKPGLYRVFGSNSYAIPDPANYQGPWDPNKKNWGSGWTFIGESDRTRTFNTDQYYQTLLILWHSGNRFNFDAMEDLVGGTALAEDAGGNPVSYNWITAGLKNYDTDLWYEPFYFKGHRNRLYARTTDWYGFSLFSMPTDSIDNGTPRQLRLTLLSNRAGDMNGDNVVDLKDAIIVLQGLANYKPDDLYPNIHTDSQIGLKEAVQVMQIVSGEKGE